MRFHVLEGSRVLVDLRAGGLLRSLAHSPTLTARPGTMNLAFTGDEAAVTAAFRADAIEAPSDMPDDDRARMRENLLGPEVLDARRYPTVDFRGTYRGTTEGGTLTGELVVRGNVTRLAIPVVVTRQWDAFVTTGSWQGKLTTLGLRPYKALLGAIKLEDWIALRLEGRFAETKG